MVRSRQIILIGFGIKSIEEDMVTLKTSIGEFILILKQEKDGIRYIVLHFTIPRRLTKIKKKIHDLNYSTKEVRSRDIFKICNFLNS